MPRIEIPVVTLQGNPLGVVRPTPVANSNLTDNHVLSNLNDHMYLEVVNTIATPTNVVLVTPSTVGGRAIADDTVAIAASETRLLGPFDRDVYTDALQVNVTVTTLALRAYQTIAP